MEELVKGFVDGQISRRVFIRRLVTAGVALTGAVAYADLLAADPAAAAAFSVYVTDYAFTPQKSVLGGPGDYVSWVWNGASGHTVSEASGAGLFDSSQYGALDESGNMDWNWVSAFGWEMWAAGTFPYVCKDEYHAADPMTGKIRVPIGVSATSGDVGKTIEVIWGSRSLLGSPTFRYEVQLRKPGGEWKDWVVDGEVPGRYYKARAAGKHQFRARLRNIVKDRASGWSPIATFTAS